MHSSRICKILIMERACNPQSLQFRHINHSQNGPKITGEQHMVLGRDCVHVGVAATVVLKKQNLRFVGHDRRFDEGGV